MYLLKFLAFGQRSILQINRVPLRRQSFDPGPARDQKQNEWTDYELQKADSLTR
jgi:hypothetical protein